MEKDFDGKVVLVTGAASGIGRATALAFARSGAKTFISDVDSQGGEATLALARAAGAEARFLRCDVSRASDVEQLVGAALQAWDRLDCAFNNAGIEGMLAPLTEYPEEMWNRVLAVNLTGAWLCLKHELKAMRRRGRGAIVNNASILGTVGFANAAAYTAAKHGLVGLTQTAALECATEGIRVNAVCPGFIETPMLARAGLTTNAESRKTVEALHPMKRLGRSEEIAAAVLWLCSDAASFVTGQAIHVDGGYIAQ
jgi:NAD(P)-dependent dehydrogenase (short-subunit alcohol dehydrogenase family)